MEEDIKILEELEEFMKEELRAEHSIFSIEQLQAIQNLIARYKELEEENKRYSETIRNLYKEKEYYKKQYAETYDFLKSDYTGDHIPRID